MAVNAELRRRLASNPDETVPWLLNPDGTEPVSDEVARERLASIHALIAAGLAVTVAGGVDLGPATLAALEHIELGPTTSAALGALATEQGQEARQAALVGLLGALTTEAGEAARHAASLDVLTSLRDTIGTEDFAQEAMQAARASALDLRLVAQHAAVTALLSAIRDVLDNETATDVAALAIRDEIALYRTEIAARDLATGAGQQAVLAAVDGLEAMVSTLAAFDFATGAQQVSANTLLDTIRTHVDGLEASLVNINANLLNVFRRTDPLAAGTNLIGNVGSISGTKVGQGKFFIATIGRVSLSLAGNLRMALTNPAGSGKNLILGALTCMATQVGWASVHINPTQGVPATGDRPRSNAIAGGGLASVATLRVDTSATTALSGGIDPGWVFGIPPNKDRRLDLPPVIVAPGITLGVNIPFAGQADVGAGLFWYEE